MTSFATFKHGSVNSFDFDDEYNHSNIIDGDLMGSLNPSLVNNVFQIVDHEDSGCSSHDSPSSCVSNSTDDDGAYIGDNNQVEDFDLYDLGGAANGGADSLYDSFPSTNAQASKISDVQMNDLMVESYLNGFAHPLSDKQQSQQQQQQQQQQTLKNAALIAAMKQQATPTPYAQLTPQQIQEQLLFIQQQRAHLAAAAAAAAAQQYTAATYGPQVVPFANSFLPAYHQTPQLPGFIHPSATMSLSTTMNAPVAEDSFSTKKDSRSSSPTSVQQQQQQEEQDKQTANNSTKQSSASKKKVSTAKRPRDINAKSPTEEALAELESKKPATAEEDKELKRQRRLIKNRESAQASRERKKLYVKGLETRVEELSTENKSLNSKIQTLEEENRRLRERLNLLDPSGLYIHDSLEPENKKRKLNKILPSITTKPMTTYNPFDLNFWTAFMSGYPNQQTAAQMPQHQMPAISSEQQSSWTNPSAISSKRVVMFIMLFCVAVMIMLPKDLTNSLNTTSSPSTTTTSDSTSSASLSSDMASSTLLNGRGRGVGRTLKTVSVDDGFSTRIKMIYDQFGRLMQSENATHTASSSSNMNSDIDPFSFSVELDRKTKSLVISLPLEENENNIETKKEGLQQVLETKSEAQMEIKIKKESIATEKEDGSSPTVKSLSLDMLREICRVVNI